MSSPTLDRRRRPLCDLRLSVTDRCNFRCRYCMPREHFGPGFRFLPRAEILSFEEIARVVRVFAGLGIQKLRLTGGEPLLRSDLSALIAMLRAAGDFDLALTTNGALLEKQAAELAQAGLGRVTVSLDSLDADVFARMTDSDTTPAQVLAGIDAAAAAGLGPIKINAVIKRNLNDHGLLDLARRFKGTGHVLRFIEFMDVGATNDWRLDHVVSGREIIERISAELPLEPLQQHDLGQVAKRWRYRDGGGEIGVITSVTEPFCSDCSRARLGADGMLYTCLFAAGGTDLRPALRSGASDEELRQLVEQIWTRREDRYSELRSANTLALPRVEMSYIGG
jgi:GTP 3',8-cyclase